MSQLGDAVRVTMADTFAMYLKTHNYHWNVEGENFYQYHEFFKNLYEELFAAVDVLAEEIRGLNEYAPGSFSRFSELSSIEDATTVPDGVTMAANLLKDNGTVIASLMNAFKLAEAADKVGLSNKLQDRIDIHTKHHWMLRSTTKNR
jgi:starvation-inducible DNA-binding protein